MPSSFIRNLPPTPPRELSPYLPRNRTALTLHSPSVAAIEVYGRPLDEHDRVAGARLVLDRGRHAKRCHLGAQPRDVGPQRLLGQVSVVPRIDEKPARGDEVRRPAHQEDEKLELALGERDHPIAIGERAPVVIDLQSLQLPLARVPELETPSIAEQLILEGVHIVVDDVRAGRGGQARELGAYSLQEILFEADHLLVDADPVPRVLGEQRLGVLAFEETVGPQGGDAHRVAFWPCPRTNYRTNCCGNPTGLNPEAAPRAGA